MTVGKDADAYLAADFDNWVGLFANRNEMADEYAFMLRRHGSVWRDWENMNAAILRRWSPAGLAYIKARAWQIVTDNL